MEELWILRDWNWAKALGFVVGCAIVINFIIDAFQWDEDSAPSEDNE